MSSSAATPDTTAKVRASLDRRHRAEKRFKLYGLISISLGLLFVAVLFADIIGKGHTAFQQTFVQIEIEFAEEAIDPNGQRDAKAL